MVTQEYKNKRIYKTKGYVGSYKKKLNKINKKRVRLNTKHYINNVFDDLEDFVHDYELHGNPLYDMYGKLINKEDYEDYEEYLAIEDPDWLEYLDRTGTLEDEFAYCDKVFGKLQPKEKYNFKDEEIDYAVNSWNSASNKQELDPIQRAMNAYQAVRDWQNAWRKYGVIGAVKLYFSIGNKDG